MFDLISGSCSGVHSADAGSRGVCRGRAAGGSEGDFSVVQHDISASGNGSVGDSGAAHPYFARCR